MDIIKSLCIRLSRCHWDIAWTVMTLGHLSRDFDWPVLRRINTWLARYDLRKPEPVPAGFRLKALHLYRNQFSYWGFDIVTKVEAFFKEYTFLKLVCIHYGWMNVSLLKIKIPKGIFTALPYNNHIGFFKEPFREQFLK